MSEMDLRMAAFRALLPATIGTIMESTGLTYGKVWSCVLRAKREGWLVSDGWRGCRPAMYRDLAADFRLHKPDPSPSILEAMAPHTERAARRGR